MKASVHYMLETSMKSGNINLFSVSTKTESCRSTFPVILCASLAVIFIYYKCTSISVFQG
jgi:hypothetical protein